MYFAVFVSIFFQHIPVFSSIFFWKRITNHRHYKKNSVAVLWVAQKGKKKSYFLDFYDCVNTVLRDSFFVIHLNMPIIASRGTSSLLYCLI